MKQKICIAALLAGMLVLAGCGGGSSATGPGSGSNDDTGTTQQELNAEVAKLTAELAKDSPDSEMVTTLRKVVDDLLKGNLADGVTTAAANQAIGRANQVIDDANETANASSMASAEKLVAAFANTNIFADGNPYGTPVVIRKQVHLSLEAKQERILLAAGMLSHTAWKAPLQIQRPMSIPVREILSR